MNRFYVAAMTLYAWAMAISCDANAHGFVGTRFFPATLTTDDPFAADELTLPTVSTFKDPAVGADPAVRNTDIAVGFAKRLTPDLAIELGATWKHLTPQGRPSADGFDNFEAGVKYNAFQSDRHEAIVSVGVDADIGGTGAARVGAEKFSTITPTLFLGKGFGDIPDGAKFLKPFAVTAVAGIGFPTRRSTIDDTGSVARNPTTLRLGFAVEYSLPYLQSSVRDIGLGTPFNRVTPLVEVSLQTPLNRGEGGKTTGTINPGFVWAGQSVQFGVEALIPLNGRTGHNVGFLAQLHFFLDDLFPTTFGRPLWGGHE